MKAPVQKKFLKTLALFAVGIVACSGDGLPTNQGGNGGAAEATGGSGPVASGGMAGNSSSSTGGAPAGNTGGAATGGNAAGGAAAGGNAAGGAVAGGNAAGGAAGSTSGNGGATGAGGATTPSGVCTEADKTVDGSGSGPHCGYTYENWVDSGSGTASLTLKTDGFSITWNKINNVVGREGVRPGSGDLVTTYQANYQPNGNSYLCLYGWTTSPLIEYYVVDSWGTWKPPGGTSLGTLTSDGGTYDIYKMQRTNQPSIQGNTTFYQYWSVRQQKRTSGTITLANHVAAWASKGLNLGTFYEVSMTVEGYQSSGTADVKFTIK